VYRKNAKVETSPEWRRRLDASRENRDDHASRWRENKALLIGTGNVKGLKRGEVVNLAWAAFQTMVGTIYAQNPRPVIRAKKGLLEDTAKMLTDIVVSDLEDMRSRYVTRLCIADVFWAGFGLVIEKLQSDVTSVGYRYVEQEGRVDVPKNQRYSLHRAHPESVLFDSTAAFPDLSDSRFLAIEFYPTKKDLKDDNLLTVNEEMLGAMKVLSAPPAMDDRQSGGTQWTNPRNPDSDDYEESDDMAQVRCIEIWDRVNLEKIYMADGMDEVLGREKWPMELRLNGEVQFPATMLYFNENPDELYPIPEISMIAPQLKQYSILFKQMLRDAVEKFRKFVVRGDLLQKGHESKLKTAEQNSIISIDPTKVPGTQQLRLEDVIRPVPDPQVDRDTIAVEQFVKQTLYEIIGSGDFASGGMRNTRSATEAAALSDFLRTRMTTRTENMDAFFKSLITKHVLFLQETLTEPRAVLTTDENGLAVWADYNKEDIAGVFGFSVIAGSSMPQNTETRRQENVAFFQQVLPIVLQSGGNPRPFIEWIAPYFSVPGYLVDETYNNHKQALQQLVLMYAAMHAGQKIDPTVVLEAISQAINTGLSPADIQNVVAQQQQAAAKQPVSLPGTNTSNQTVS